MNLALQLSGKYSGSLVISNQRGNQESDVEIERVNNLLVNIRFAVDGKLYSFKAMLSEQKEGILMMVQQKVADFYVLRGVSGFLFDKPNVHGGLVDLLSSLYFNIRIDFFDGRSREVYFLGKPHLQNTTTEGSATSAKINM